MGAVKEPNQQGSSILGTLKVAEIFHLFPTPKGFCGWSIARHIRMEMLLYVKFYFSVCALQHRRRRGLKPSLRLTVRIANGRLAQGFSQLATREANLHTCFWLQRAHLGVPAVVVDGVALRHPQRRTLSRREKRQEDHKLDPSAANAPTSEAFPLSTIQYYNPCNQTLIQHTDHKRSWSSVMEENGLHFNYFCSVIPIYSGAIKSKTPYFRNPPCCLILLNPL